MIVDKWLNKEEGKGRFEMKKIKELREEDRKKGIMTFKQTTIKLKQEAYSTFSEMEDGIKWMKQKEKGKERIQTIQTIQTTCKR